jgi:Uma2 family endonuclease
MLAYRQIGSLREYVLIDQKRRRVEIYRRTEAGWGADIFAADYGITLKSANLQVSMNDLYEGSGVP